MEDNGGALIRERNNERNKKKKLGFWVVKKREK